LTESVAQYPIVSSVRLIIYILCTEKSLRGSFRESEKIFCRKLSEFSHWIFDV